MMKNVIQSVQKHKFIYVLIAVILYQIVCALQGFDLSDEGWGMYFYQQIFKNPECVVAQMPYWVTGVIGGGWNLLFPEGGFFGTRMLGVIMVTGTFCISYVFLRKSIDSGWLLVGLVAQILIVAGDPKPYGYNSLTAFIILLVIIVFWRGLEKDKSLWLFLGGILLGVNIFVRIPNFAILPIVLVIPAYLYWKTGKIQLFTRQVWVTVLGVIVGTFVVIMAMSYWGYWPLFMEAITGVTNSVTDETNSHEFGRLVVRYTKNYWGIISVGSLLVLFGGAYVWLRKLLKIKWMGWLLSFLFLCAWIYADLRMHTALRSNDMYFAQFISYAGSILILIHFNKNKNFRLRYIALTTLFMLIFMPLGSDQGIITMWTSAWLGLPLGAAYLYRLFSGQIYWHKKLERFSSNKEYIELYLSIIFVAYIAAGIYKVDNWAYYDPNGRLEKVHSIHNRYCRNIYTISYRANLINELLPVLEKYVKPDDYLLIYNFMPGLNYMTDTRSYISNAWLWCLSGNELEQQFQASEVKNKPLPVVLIQNFRATNSWGEYDPHFTDINQVPNNPLSRSDQIRAVNDFLDRNHYKKVWTNQYFDILLPGT